MTRTFAPWPPEWPVDASFDDMAWLDGKLYRRVRLVGRTYYFDRMRTVPVMDTRVVLTLYDLTQTWD